MYHRQKREIDALVRVRTFLNENPATGPLGYGDARATLDGVIERLDSHAGAQALGHELSRAEVLRQKEQIDLIFDVHMRPIATIARAQIEPGSDVGLPAGLRLPKRPLPPTKALAACHAMIEAARPFEALLVAKGMPADFLVQFEAARDALERMRGNRSLQVGRRVTAGAGLDVELRRGRGAVSRLDAIVRASFRGDAMRLKAWRFAKRVQKQPGGSGPRVVPEVSTGADQAEAAA